MMRDLHRRIMSAFGIGNIRATSESATLQTAQIELSTGEKRDRTLSLGHYGFFSRPLAGAEMVMISISGDRDKGIIIATGDQRYHLQMADGEVAISDHLGQKVHLTSAGMILDGAGLPIIIQNTPMVTADTPLLRCTGDIQDNYLTNDVTMAGDRLIYDIHTHNVENIQSGGTTRISDRPNQLE